MHLNLVGWTKHKGSKTCGQTQFSSQLPTPFLRPAHPPKQRSNPGWFAPWSANKAVTWTLQDTSTKSQNTRSLTLTAHRQMHARTHPTLLARDSHYGNQRRTRRKMTVQSVRRVQKSRLNVANDVLRALTFCTQVQARRKPASNQSSFLLFFSGTKASLIKNF